jgi:membrane-associated protease RseP (regulator of RpoE activity)
MHALDVLKSFGRHATHPRSLCLAIAVAAVVGSFLPRGMTRADEPADAPATPPPFEAGDISIGDPIALPFSTPVTDPATPTPVLSGLPPVAPPPAAMTTPTARSAGVGSGWLGIVVAESVVPGRFTVDEVAANGPALVAGILAGDEVRAINGLPMRNADDVAQALTAIAPGQQVRLAIARGDQVADVTLAAIERPAPTSGWAAASPQAVAALPPAALPPAAPPPAAPPSFASPTNVAGPSQAAPPATSPRPPRPSEPLPIPGAAPGSEAVGGRTALGVRTIPIDAGMQARFRLPEARGAYVIGVVGDLPASRAGVPPGSVIVAIDEQPVRSPEELTRLVTSGPVGRPLPLEFVLPGGTSRRADVVLQTLEQPLEAALLGSPMPAATDVPTLQAQPTPTTARRLPAASRVDMSAAATTSAALDAEIRQLRARIERLEQRLGDD